MFGRKKKVKIDVEKNWQPFVEQIFIASKIDPKTHPEKDYLYAYSIGFLDEYVRSRKGKGQQGVLIANKFATDFFEYSPEEKMEVEKRIRRSTSSIDPMFLEGVIRGQEAFQHYDQDRVATWLGKDVNAFLLIVEKKIKDDENTHSHTIDE